MAASNSRRRTEAGSRRPPPADAGSVTRMDLGMRAARTPPSHQPRARRVPCRVIPCRRGGTGRCRCAAASRERSQPAASHPIPPLPCHASRRDKKQTRPVQGKKTFIFWKKKELTFLFSKYKKKSLRKPLIVLYLGIYAVELKQSSGRLKLTTTGQTDLIHPSQFSKKFSSLQCQIPLQVQHMITATNPASDRRHGHASSKLQRLFGGLGQVKP